MRCYIRCQLGREDLVTRISDFQHGCCAFTPCTTNFVASEPIILANTPRIQLIGVACNKLIWTHYAVKESKIVTNFQFLFSTPISYWVSVKKRDTGNAQILSHQNIKSLLSLSTHFKTVSFSSILQQLYMTKSLWCNILIIGSKLTSF